MTVSLMKNLAEMDPRKRKLLEMMLEKEGRDLSEMGIFPRSRTDEPLPLSYAQERLFFLNRLEPDHPAYNVFTPLRLRGPLSPHALVDGLSEIVRRHEVLRTGFVLTDEGPVQQVGAPRPLSVPRVSLEGLGPADAEAEIRRLAKEEARRPFDLSQPPMLRAILVRRDDLDHALLLDTHHMSSDAWSLEILVREVGQLYRSFQSGSPSAAPAPTVQYGDYALWQRRRLSGDLLERQLGYWRERLAGLERLDLPTDMPRPKHRAYRGAQVRWELGPEVTGALRKLARDDEASMFMVFAALWGAALSHWANETDVAIGTPIANRERSEIQNLVGFFLNTLVLRLDVSADPDFHELLRRARRMALEAFEHQELPFEKLVEELAPERSLASTPLFQTLLVVHNNPVRQLRTGGLALETLDIHNDTAKFDCTLSVTLTEGRAVGFFEYDQDMFHATTIQRWARGFERLCSHAAMAPERPLSSWAPWSPAERHQLVAEWNDTSRKRGARCLHHAIAAQAESSPDAVALVFEETCLTYGELLSRSRRLASRLRARGAGPETPVGLYMHRSLELLVGALGILETGAPYMPLDPEYPTRRIVAMLEEASRGDSPLVVAQRALRDRLLEAGVAGDRLCLVDAAETFATREVDPTRIPVQPDHPAYVIHTSGSTGRPKGVINAHRGIGNRLAWMQEAFGLGPRDRVLQKTPISFDVSVWELFWPLLHGARLVVARPEGHRDDAYLARVIEGEGITTLHFVPSMLEPFLELPDLSGVRSLCRVLSSGEALRRDLVERFHDRVDAELHNLYGPTEAAVDVTWWPTRPGASRIPIGRPIDNLELHVLDRRGRVAPLGIAGELHLAGIGLARGYLSRPALTAERFVPKDVGGGLGQRHYRTGDLARWLPTGDIEFLGRLDHQVKVRGLRIELGEIETRLLDHPKVHQAVVVTSESSGHDRLVAYVVADQIESLTTTLREHLAESLPAYMLPAMFIPLESIPMTRSGKVDRRSLPRPDLVRPDLSSSFQAPRSSTESLLAEVWEDVLGVDRVGVRDSFFELGGDSILSLQIVSRLARRGLRVTAKDFFEHPTIEAQARIAEKVTEGEAPRGPLEGPVPLLPAQRRFFEWTDTDPHHFNQAVLVRVTRALSVRHLERALAAVADHHDALRMRYQRDPEDGVWRQTCTPPDGSISLEVIEGSTDPVHEAARIQAGLDLEQGPISRVGVFRDDGETHLLWVVHHLAVDGVSWRILLEDLESALGQAERDQPIALPPTSVSLKTWGELLSKRSRAEILDEQLQLWRRMSEPPQPIPLDHPGGDNLEASAHRVRRSLSAKLSRALVRETAPKAHATVEELLLTALTVVLTRWSGSSVLRLDLEGHGREELNREIDLSRTVGWLTSIFPVQWEAGDRDHFTVLRKIKNVLRGIPHRGLDYGVLRDVAGRPELRNAARSEVSFNYLGRVDSGSGRDSRFVLCEAPWGPTHAPRAERWYVLDVQVAFVDDHFEISWIHSRDLHRPETVEARVEEFLQELRELVEGWRSAQARPSLTPSDFPLLEPSEDDLDRLVQLGENLADAYPLTPLQEGILFHVLYRPDSGHYVQQLDLTLEGKLDLGAFEAAWRDVVDHHPVLRTAFVWDELDSPLQVVYRRASIPLDVKDLQARSEAEQDAWARRFLEEDRHRSFDPSEAPLMRLKVLLLGDRRFRLVWTHHHLILDGWSVQKVLEEALARYRARQSGRDFEPASVRPFRDYVERLEERDREAEDRYWSRVLAGASKSGTLEIGPPPRQAQEQGRGQTELRLSPEITDRLLAFGRRRQLTTNTLLQGAWALLIERYGLGRDVIFGTTVSGRTMELSGIEDMVGLFINTLPVRVVNTPTSPVEEWLRAIQQQNVQSRDFEHVSLARLTEKAGRVSGDDLFETLVVYENYPIDDTAMASEAEPRVSSLSFSEASSYPLALVSAPGHALPLRLRWEPSRFETRAAERLLRHLANLLENLVADGRRRLGDVEMLGSAERRQLLRTWNEPDVEYPEPLSIPHHFRRVVDAKPESVALVSGSHHLTYGEIARRAHRLARSLRRRGAGPETRVVLSMGRSPETVLVLLAILSSGAAFVPVDPSYPIRRRRWMFEDSEATLVVTDGSAMGDSEGVFGPDDSRVVRFDRLATVSDAESAESLRAPDPDTLAYIIYTSGSTGRPKGVMIPHRGVANRLLFALGAGHIYPWERYLQKASISFDVSLLEIFIPFLAGATTVLAAPGREGDATHLVRLIVEENLTQVVFPPSLLRAVLEEPEMESAKGLTTVVSSAEALSVELQKDFFSRFDIDLYNRYGPTETSIAVSSWTCRPDRVERIVPIGRPIARARLYVVDQDLRPTPVGVAGELVVGGISLGRGYFRRPARTAESFVPDPLGQELGKRLYRTGDLVRYRSDGALEFLGRIDHQVKIRGFRVELPEIETVLEEHPEVRDVAVVDVEGARETKVLVAYVTLRHGGGDLRGELETWVGERLPAYMVPSRFVVLEALPRDPNGKIDRRALPAPEEAEGLRDPSENRPQTPTEEMVAAIFARVLEVDQVRARDDFFTLGGHSLLATRIVSRARRAFDVEIPLTALFDEPTVTGFAAKVESALRAGRTESSLPLESGARDGSLPLSFAQERLWLLDRLSPGDPTYNMGAALVLRGRLQVSALHAAFEEIFRRHEVLRTRILEEDGRPRQVIAPFSRQALPVVDLRGLAPADSQREADFLATMAQRRPFSLRRGPLARVHLVVRRQGDHVLLTTVHHVVFDGWSVGVLSRELSSHYRAYVAGRVSEAPEPLVQYGDFALWQRRREKAGEFREQLEYWTARLQRPSSRPLAHLETTVSSEDGFRGGRAVLHVSDERALRLRQLVEQEGVTPFMALLAVLQVLLGRIGREDASPIIGTPVAGRRRVELEGLIGCFLNTLAIPSDLEGSISFRELLGRVRRESLGAFAHQDLPFERLLAELQPQRDLKKTPLFQVFFNVLNLPRQEMELPGLTLEIPSATEVMPKFDLNVYVTDRDGGLALHWIYDTAVLDGTDVEVLIAHFDALLQQVTENPACRLDELSLAIPGRFQIPDPQCELPKPRVPSVVEALRAAVDAHPSVPAVRQGALTWSYEELWRTAGSLAEALRKKGLEEGDVVAVRGERCPGLVAAIVAVPLAGGVLLTLDPRLPGARQKTMLQQSGARFLAHTGVDLQEDATVEGLQTLEVEARTGRALGGVETGEETFRPVLPAQDDPAYIFFTSGTTGRPKGILGRHAGLGHFLAWQREAFHVGPGDRVGQLTGLSFDVVLRDLFLPLTSGALLCLPPADGDMGPDRVLPWLEEEGVTLLHTVPAVVQLWLTSPPEGVTLSSMRCVFFAGEPLTDALVSRFREVFSGVGEIVNLYGPTETTLAKCAYRVPTPPLPGVQPIGRPLPQTQVLVRRSDGRLCGTLEPGEIVIRTPFRSLGYLRPDEGTKQSFRSNPFRRDPEDVLYATGDAGFYRPDGNLAILGRLDDQVKIRGVRVEPQEVELVLRRLPFVDHGVVVVREDPSGQSHLLAYAVLAERGTASPGDLRSALARELPEALVPSTVVLLPELPLTPNGKVDRSALPEPPDAEITTQRVAPRDELEESLALIWRDVLDVDQVGVHESFFDLGGHSLLATQVVSRVRDQLGVELSLRAFFEAPSIVGLAREARRRLVGSEAPEAPPLEPVSRDGDLPLSFAQQRLWFLDRFEPDRATYNIPSAFELEGRLSLDALAQAFGRIVQRHEVLRTTFGEREGHPNQVIHEPNFVSLPVVDLSRLPSHARQAEMERRIRGLGSRPFRLDRGPLARVALVRTADETHVAVVCFHHIVSDAWSTGVLIRELAAHYGPFVEGRAAKTSPLPLQYADFAAWQRRWLSGETLERQVAWWRERLEGAPEVLELPTDRPRPAARSFRGGYNSRHLTPETSQRLNDLARREHVTPFMVLTASFQTLLSRYSRQRDVVLGTPIAHRNRAALEGLIGFFVNTLVIRTTFEDAPTFRALLDRVRESALGAFAHQDLPFEKLVEEMDVGRNLSHSPIFQAMLVVQNTPRETLRLPGLDLTPLEVRVEEAKFDLTLVAMETRQGWRLSVLYDRDLFDETRMIRLLGHLENLLDAAWKTPSRPVLRLPWLSAPEHHQLTLEWPDRERSNRDSGSGREVGLHRRFAAHVRRRPDAVALVDGNRQMSYGELARRSERLSARLRAEGARPETVVAVCLEPSSELVVAILAILQTGAAYLPLDPSHPLERRTFMLHDAGVHSVVANGEWADELKGTGVRVLDPESPAPASTDIEGMDFEPESGMEILGDRTLAYVIYTSGSTGRPKGTLVTHHNVSRLFDSTESEYRFSPRDVWTLFHSHAFDFSVWEIWGALLYGGRLVVVPYWERRTPEDFYELLDRERVTILNQTPSAFRQLIWAEQRRQEDLPTTRLALRQVIFGGEALDPSGLRPWVEVHGLEQPRLVNMYGITETTVHVTWRSLEAADVSSGHRSPVGRAIPDLSVRVVNEASMEPVPIGVPGELWVEGAGLARGYLKRPALTAERFSVAPAGKQGHRVYRSGDLACFLPTGELAYLGRIDQQVKIRGFRIELGEIEAELLRRPEIQGAVVLARPGTSGESRLVAWIVPRPGGEIETESLRKALRARLTEYMIPAAFVVLEDFPLTPNGKLDRAALPAPDWQGGEHDFELPRGDREIVLAEIWAKVLGVDRVGRNDNFFELGGDSILSIQIVSQAKLAGLELTPKQIFQHQTVAELAAASSTVEIVEAEQGMVTGPVPAIPIQSWFFDRELVDAHHFNQAILLHCRESLHPGRLQRAVERLLGHHDALRSACRLEDGTWGLEILAPRKPVPYRHLDLSAVSPEHAHTTLEREVNRVQVSFDLSTGPLLRVASFDLGAAGHRILLVAHHLVVDGVSWRILLEDLQRAYRGESLPPKTTSFRRWAEALRDVAASGVLEEERDYWHREVTRETTLLPVDRPNGENVQASVETYTVSLSETRTQALLRDVPGVYRTQVNDVLLTALAQGVARWTGGQSVRIHLEGHGRQEELVPNVDLSRTVGWFTSLFPVCLTVVGDPATDLKRIKEKLRRVPRHGLGYGLLRYSSHEEKDLEATVPGGGGTQISFNYFGRLDRVLDEEALFEPAPETPGTSRSPRASRGHLLEINAAVTDGRLQVSWSYGSDVLDEATVRRGAEAFAESLESLIDHCLSEEAGGFTPSDFPLAEVTQEQLDTLIADRPGLEDLYPLSSMQQGMLFHTLAAPRSGLYLQQLVATLEGDLDHTAFRTAWQRLLARHPVLRTGFVLEGFERPLQAVSSDVELPWHEDDWRGRSDEEQERELESLLLEDRRRGFDVTEPPLMRITLLRTDEASHRLVWTSHHLLYDGWSLPLMLRETFALYEALAQGKEPVLAQSRPFRDYIAWLERRNEEDAREFWRDTLEGFRVPTPLPTERRETEGEDRSTGEERVLRFSKEVTRDLGALARSWRLTLNTLLQGAWGALLSRLSGQEDVVFGSTVSGRPAELEGVEDMIGLFINTLPVRVRTRIREPLESSLQELQAQLLEQQRYQATPLARIQAVSELPRGTELFDTVFIFENYPVGDVLGQAMEADHRLRVSDVQSMARSNYPLTLLGGTSDEGLIIRWLYDPRHLDTATVGRFSRHLDSLLSAFAEDPERPVGALPLLEPAERFQILREWNDTATAYDRRGTLHGRFEQQVSRRPEAVAVVAPGTQWSYDELNRRANRLAHHLGSLGIGRGDFVAIQLERAPEMVLAVLAVLKAGAAYVPLEPSYPSERVRYITSVLGTRALLTQSFLMPELKDLADAVPEHLICLDAERLPEPPPKGAETWALADLAQYPETNPQSQTGAEDLAYVIFTSGSTGFPKGVVEQHRPVINLIDWIGETFHVGPEDRVLFVTSLCFDLSVYDIFGLLAAGGSIRVALRDEVDEPRSLVGILQQEPVTFWDSAPPALNRLVPVFPQEPQFDTALRLVFLSGDWIPLALPDQVRGAFPEAHVVGLGGATEATIWSNFFEVGEVSPAWVSIPYGRPIANARYHVVDPFGEPCPIGVEGDLWIGGECLSLGYSEAPRLTAERYLPDPFGSLPGGVVYRTGDRARYWGNGLIEFLGRIDHQVKIRGFRIELGEIEAALAAHPGVSDTVVLARNDENDETRGPEVADRRLVAYVVPDARGAEAQAETEEEQISQWQTVYDETYRGTQDEEDRDEPEDVTFNIAGWNSSFTGDPIPAVEMRSWLETTVDRLQSFAPRRVLEIGCGTGMLLYRLAPFVERYHGTDISAVALETIERHLAEDLRSRVSLEQRSAEAWEGVEAGSFDLVVLNSVSQHFPDVGYLVRVLTGAVDALSDDGILFVGDVRSLPHLEAFHAAVEWERSDRSLDPAHLWGRIQERLVREEELVISPDLFSAWAARSSRVTRVDIQLKRGRFDNEMCRYRFDAVLHLGAREPQEPETVARWNEDVENLEDVRQMLLGEPEQGVRIEGIPNRRLGEERRLLDELHSGDLGARSQRIPSAAGETEDGIEPEDLWELGRDLKREVEVRFAADPTAMHASFWGPGHPKPRGPWDLSPEESEKNVSWIRWANDPQRGRVARALEPRLRLHLEERLPEYMMPSSFVLLDTFPLTANGKLDRRALPAPRASTPDSKSEGAVPTTEMEKTLARIWSEVLGLSTVGIQDNFFELGGDSILSVQVIARAQQEGLSLTARHLFLHPTIEGLVSTLEMGQGSMADSAWRATPDQSRLLDSPESARFARVPVIDVLGDLSMERLETVIQELLSSHEALRLRFELRQDGWWQIVGAMPETMPVERVRIADLGENEARSLEDKTAARLFDGLDPARGPLLRAALLDRGDEAPARLLLAIHPLAVDEASWKRLLEDLEIRCIGESLDTLGDEAGKGGYRLWLNRLGAGTTQRSGQPAEESAPQRKHPAPALYHSHLSKEEARDLQQTVERAFRSELDLALTACLAHVLAQDAEAAHVVLDVETEGFRSEHFEPDLTQVVGRASIRCPVRLRLEDASNPEVLVRECRDALHRASRKSVEYAVGLLAGRKPVPADGVLHYLPPREGVASEGSLFQPVRDVILRPEQERSVVAPLELRAFHEDGGLTLDWTFYRGGLSEAQAEARIARGMDFLRQLIEAGRSVADSSLSAEEFPRADVSQEELDALLDSLG